MSGRSWRRVKTFFGVGSLNLKGSNPEESLIRKVRIYVRYVLAGSVKTFFGVGSLKTGQAQVNEYNLFLFLLRAECLLYVAEEEIFNFNHMLDGHNRHKVEEHISIPSPFFDKKYNIVKLGLNFEFVALIQ